MKGKKQKQQLFPRAFLRILDANYNRAKEALRVCEDLSRFLINDRGLASAYKSSRHRLTRLLLDFPASYSDLLGARNSVRDVGRDHFIQDIEARPGWQDLMAANMKRSQEALRVLEEVSRAADPKSTAGFRRLRFSLYELEKKSVRKF